MTMMRIFRCLLIYINYRLLKIKEEIWKYGGFIPDNNQNVLSDTEKGFLVEYKKNIYDYQNSIPIDIDLYTDMTPPKDLTIEIRVLEDYGEILTSAGGVIVLEKGTTLSTRRCDVEHLIKKNIVIQTK